MTDRLRRILLISGSIRSGSTHSAVLRTAGLIAAAAVETELYERVDRLPHFNPDDDPPGGPVHPEVAELRAQLARADGVLFCTPEYAGALPGSFKNLLDWTVGGGETYGMAVAWINAAGPAAPTGAAGAHDSLRAVLGYTGSQIVESACVRIPVTRADVGTGGTIADAAIRAQIAASLELLTGASAG